MKRAKGKSNLAIVADYLEGNRPFTQISMAGIAEFKKRKEGEEWEDSTGKRWKKENGRKVAVSKTSKIINEQRCMICNADVRWGNKYDKQVWPATQKCYDCFIEFNTKLEINGLTTNFKKFNEMTYLRSYLLDLKPKLEETINWCSNPENKKIKFHNDDGTSEVEVWEDNTDAVNKIKVDAENDLALVNDRLKDVDMELRNLDSIPGKVKEVEKSLKDKYKDGRNTPEFTIEVLNK